jgi:hypothetical protein
MRASNNPIGRATGGGRSGRCAVSKEKEKIFLEYAFYSMIIGHLFSTLFFFPDFCDATNPIHVMRYARMWYLLEL